MPDTEQPRDRDRKHRGKAGTDRSVRGIVRPGTPIVFLDFDDVLCVGRPYSGFDVLRP
jgi:hypothetical protein